MHCQKHSNFFLLWSVHMKLWRALYYLYYAYAQIICKLLKWNALAIKALCLFIMPLNFPKWTQIKPAVRVCVPYNQGKLFKRMKGPKGCIKVSKSWQRCLYRTVLPCEPDKLLYIKYRLHDPNNVARQEMSLSCDTSKATSTSLKYS